MPEAEEDYDNEVDGEGIADVYAEYAEVATAVINNDLDDAALLLALIGSTGTVVLPVS